LAASSAAFVLIYRIAKRVYPAIDRAIPMWDNNTLSFQKFIKLMNQTENSGWNVELISLGVVILCWMVSTVHAFYLGLNKERSQKTEDRSQNLKPED
jgi:hypothetical protein